jgi:hypothetical protein
MVNFSSALVVILLILPSVWLNIWDNFYSNLSSDIRIPEELKIKLYSKETRETKIGEIYISAFHNKVNIILYSTLQLSNIFKKTGDFKRIASFSIDFDTGNIILTTEAQCIYRKMPYVDNLSISFILVSYDLLTYFNETEAYYEYIVTQPSEYTVLDNLIKLIGVNYLTYNGSLESKSLVVFKINKRHGHLEKIAFKYTNGDYVVFYTDIIEAEILDKDLYRDAYMLSEISSSLCEYIEDEKSFFQIIYNQITKIN